MNESRANETRAVFVLTLFVFGLMSGVVVNRLLDTGPRANPYPSLDKVEEPQPSAQLAGALLNNDPKTLAGLMDSETLGQDAEDNDPEFAKERDERARQIVSTRGASWTHATAATAVPIAAKVFAVEKLPTKILIDAQGKIVARVEEGAELDTWLEKLLGGKP